MINSKQQKKLKKKKEIKIDYRKIEKIVPRRFLK